MWKIALTLFQVIPKVILWPQHGLIYLLPLFIVLSVLVNLSFLLECLAESKLLPSSAHGVWGGISMPGAMPCLT